MGWREAGWLFTFLRHLLIWDVDKAQDCPRQRPPRKGETNHLRHTYWAQKRSPKPKTRFPHGTSPEFQEGAGLGRQVPQPSGVWGVQLKQANNWPPSHKILGRS